MIGNTRFKPDYSQGRPYDYNTQSIGDMLLEAGKIMGQNYQTGLDRAERAYEAEQKAKQYNIELGFKQRAEDREVAKENRDRLKEQFQADAVSATLYPSRFKESKLAGERSALEASIAGLPQTEREAILKQYNPTVSGNQWVSSTLASPYVNQADLVKAKSADMEIKIKDPNSAEFKALQDAELELAKRKNAIDVSGKLAVLNAQNALEESKERKKEAGLRDTYSALITPTTKTVVANEEDIKNAKVTQDNIMKLQEKYGDKVLEFYEKNPRAQSLPDSTAARTYARNRLGLKEDPVLNTLPAERFEEVPKTREEYIKDVFSKVNPIKVGASGLQTINQRVSDLYKEDPKKIEERKKVAGYTELLKGMKVDVPSTADSSVLKNLYENEVDKRKEGSGGSTKYGPGPKTLNMLNTLDIDTVGIVGGNDQKKIMDIAREYKITDDELANIISAADAEGITPVSSGTVRDEVIQYIKDNYKKK